MQLVARIPNPSNSNAIPSSLFRFVRRFAVFSHLGRKSIASRLCTCASGEIDPVERLKLKRCYTMKIERHDTSSCVSRNGNLTSWLRYRARCVYTYLFISVRGGRIDRWTTRFWDILERENRARRFERPSEDARRFEIIFVSSRVATLVYPRRGHRRNRRLCLGRCFCRVSFLCN